jgi:hypothetical protein
MSAASSSASQPFLTVPGTVKSGRTLSGACRVFTVPGTLKTRSEPRLGKAAPNCLG